MVVPSLWARVSSPLATLNGAGRFDGVFNDFSSFLTEADDAGGDRGVGAGPV